MLTPQGHESESADPCSERWGRLLDVVTASVNALTEGRAVPEVLCVELAKTLSASVVSFVRVDRSTGRTVTLTWRLVDDWSASSPQVAEGKPPFGQAHSPEQLVLPLADHPREERLAVFCRTRPWNDSDALLLIRGQHVMAAIDACAVSHSAEASAEPDGLPAPAVPPAAAPTAPSTPRPALTTREIQVLTWACTGSKARSIARRLDISERTVHKHLTNIYRKLGASDRVTAAARAIALGLVDPALEAVDANELVAPSSDPNKVSLVPIPRRDATHHRGEKASER